MLKNKGMKQGEFTEKKVRKNFIHFICSLVYLKWGKTKIKAEEVV